MQKIDVEKIMDEIRQNISEKKYSEDDLHFDLAWNENFNKVLFNEKYNYIKSNYNNPVYFPLEGNVLKVFIQKVVRRLLRFVNYSAFQYQNNYNEAVYVCVNEINKKMLQLEEQNIGQKKQIDKLEKEIQILRKIDS